MKYLGKAEPFQGDEKKAFFLLKFSRKSNGGRGGFYPCDFERGVKRFSPEIQQKKQWWGGENVYPRDFRGGEEGFLLKFSRKSNGGGGVFTPQKMGKKRKKKKNEKKQKTKTN